MKPGLRLYLIGLIAIGGIALSSAMVIEPPDQSGHAVMLSVLLSALTALTYLAPVKIAPKRTVLFYVSLQTIAILSLNPGQAALACALGVALGNGYLRRPWFNTAFNAAQITLTVLAAAALYRLLAPVSLTESGRDLRSVLAVIPAGVALYLVSSLAVDVAAAIQRRRSPFASWIAVRGSTLAPHVALVAIGAATATAVSRVPLLVIVAVAPVIAIRSMLRAATEFDAGTLRTVEELVAATDAGQPELRGRAADVAAIAARVARAHGLTPEECQRVVLAARLHDIAIAMQPAPDCRPAGAHQPERRPHLAEHAVAGAAFVERVLSLPNVAEALRYHHERYDGYGRPDGIAGKDIPREARVLAVADAWIGLTAPRTAGPVLSPEQALTVLTAGAGTTWDPAVVASLHEVVADITTAARDVGGDMPAAHPLVRAPA
jgi:HD-GYP domain-containing protein (c-di-GMP phosphodiesterase class II)